MKKVLILEDEVNIRSFVVINLQRAGYDTIEAGTGAEALEQLRQNPDIGVAILDIMLPDIDGFEVCRNIRATPIPCQFDFMAVSSYDGTATTGHLQMKKDVSVEIKGRHVVILEDILDSGLTLRAVANHLSAMEPASLKICALLDKPARREAEIEADYVGFTIPNEFVVGYGLDYNEKYRNLPFIGVLKPEVYGA